MKVSITFDKGSVTVNGTDFSNLSADEHKRIIREGTTPNYVQVPEWLVVGRGAHEAELIVRRTKNGCEEQKSVIDFIAMYGSAGFGNANDQIYRYAEEMIKLRIPAISRAMDHELVAPTIEAVKASTGLDRVFFASSGTDATDAAVMIAYRYWCQCRGHIWNGNDARWVDTCIIAAEGNLHGTTLMARSLSSYDRIRTNFGPLHPGVQHVPFGEIEAMQRVFNERRDGVVAVIIEPLQSAGGCRIPPQGYLRAVSSLCHEYGAVCIFDEVKTGFGRTGTDWAFEQFDVKPDLMCGGKSAGGGVVPVSFVAGRNDIMTCVEPGIIGTTWSASPLQCVALLGSLKILGELDLSREALRKGRIIAKHFERLDRKFPGFIVSSRGQALFRALEFRRDVPARKFVSILLEEGVYAKELGRINAIFITPPLTITDMQVEMGILAIERAITRLL